MALRDVRAGRFRIACPTCGASLLLTVPADPAATIGVEREPQASPGAAEAPREAPAPEAVHLARVGRYRVVGPGRGRAWGVGPAVELSVVRDRWATDARFLASWVLEALAATGLRHPNLAPPFAVDLADNRVFAEETIGGGTPLSDPAQGRGTLDRQARVAAVLHAARGLRSAHEQGVYHRDLGLDSIRVDPAGLVTVAGVGLGLSPAPSEPIPLIPLSEPGTRATPPSAAEAPPEPAVASDVAGLGRILATLVAGASGDRAVPPGLAALIRRGGDEIDPRERFRDLGAVVRALETELGVGGPLTPTEPDAEAFETAVAEFQAVPLLPIRRWVHRGVLAVLGLLVLAMALSGRVVAAGGWVVFAGLLAVALGCLRGWDARVMVKRRLGPLLSVCGRRDLVTLGIAGLIGLATLRATELLTTALIVTALAGALAAAYHQGLDRPLAHSRAEALARLRGLIGAWRRLGHDEESIRRYVARAGGAGWEEVYGSLFGRAAITPARARWGADLAGGRRPRFAPVQGWLLGRFDGWVAGRIAERTRIWLEPVLERDLEARGMHLLTARRKGKRAAQAVVGVLGLFRRSSDESVGLPLAAALRRAVDFPEDFLANSEVAEAATAPPRWWSLFAATYEAVFGARIRFVLGAAALAGSVVWAERNEFFSFEAIKSAAHAGAIEGDRARAIDDAKAMGRQFVDGIARVIQTPDQAEMMRLGVIDAEISSHLNGFALTLSALILIASSLVRGPRIIPFAMIGALIPLVPHLVVPSARLLDPASLMAMGLGVGLFVVGLVWNRGRDS